MTSGLRSDPLKDVKVYDGSGWQSIKGPPGPSAVSADAGNVATLGSDGLVFVENVNDLRPTHILSGGDPGLTIDSSVRGIVYDGTQPRLVIIPFESELPVGHTIWLSGGSYSNFSGGFLEIGADDNTVIQYSLAGQDVSTTWKNFPAFNSIEELEDSPNASIFLFAQQLGQPDGSPIVLAHPQDPDDCYVFFGDVCPPLTKPKRIRVAKGVGFTRLLKRLDGLWDVIGPVEEMPDDAPIVGRDPLANKARTKNIEPLPPTISGFVNSIKTK